MEPLVKKYSPKSLKEFVSQKKQIDELKSFIENYKKQKKKAALLYGASGTGKTCVVHILAKEYNLELVEVNASEFRNQSQIDLKIGNAIRQMSLFSRGKLILIDEADGIAGVEDRGGLQAVIKLIEETTYPIILTMIDCSDHKYDSMKRKCNLIEFTPLENDEVVDYLKDVCKKENISIDDTALRSLARFSGGSLNSALNDLQSISEQKKHISKDDVDFLGFRDHTEQITGALLRILKTTDINIALSAFDGVKENQDQQFLWLDENLPKEYTQAEDIANAYDSMSKADIYRRRIRINQYYRFMVYINAYLTAGISLGKKEKYQKQITYEETKRLLKIFWANQKSFKRKDIAKKIAKAAHCSAKSAFKDMVYYRTMFKKSKEFAGKIVAELEFTDEEVEWMKK